MLIVFEGVDGSGKSTYIKKLVQGLEDEGKRVTATRLPGGTKFGEKIRDVLFGKDVNTKTFHKSTRSLLYAADFLQTQLDVIMPALKRKEIVISDRWCYSELAYNYKNEDPYHKRVVETYLSLEMVKPDIIFFLTTSIEKILERLYVRNQIDGKQNGKVWNSAEKLTEIQNNYISIFGDEKGYLVNGGIVIKKYDTSEDHTIELWKSMLEVVLNVRSI